MIWAKATNGFRAPRRRRGPEWRSEARAPAGLDLGVDHAAQADAERGQVGREHLGVGDQGDAGGELGGMRAHEGGDAFATDLLLALDDDADVNGEFAGVRSEERFERLDVHPHLALVVDRAARVEVAVALGGFEGRGGPFVDGIGRLDVVVRVEKNGRGGCSVEPVGVDERMAVGMAGRGGLDEADVLHADAAEFGGNELGGAAGVGVMLRQRGDGRDAQEGLELFDEALRVGLRELDGRGCLGGHR